MKPPAFPQVGLGILAWLLVCLAVRGAVPQTIPFQGRVLVAGVPFHGTGQFKFALLNSDNSQIVWRNSDDTSPADGVPDAAVNLDVVHGLYAVLLGDTSLPNMAGNLNPNFLASGNLRLRVWFNNGIQGFQQLVPDQPLGSVPYALVAARVADNPVFTGNVGIGIESPTAPLDVAGRINATRISLGGFSALEMPGAANVFVGNAGNASTASIDSTGLGWGSLANLTVGSSNTAVGAHALSSTTLGGQNTAVGHDALRDNTTGNGNIALGWSAGRNLTTGNDNIAIGHAGVAGESGTIRIGTPGTHHTAYLAGTVKAAQFEGDGSGVTNVSGAMGTTGMVVGWGTGYTPPPSGLSGVTAIAVGVGHQLALKEDGTVVAWGNNTYDQTSVPAGLSGVTAIAAGYYHSVALKEDGTVVAWGFDPDCETCVPDGLSGVTAIAATKTHTVALKQDGTVVAWGDNFYSQSAVPAGLTGVTAISARVICTAALKQDGTVVAWGSNHFGHTSIPVGLRDITAIAVGISEVFAIQQQRWIQSSLAISGTLSAQTFLTTSDRETKQQFTPIDPQSVLAKVAQLPVSEWSFKSDPGVRHLGPMAQDFHAAFGLGPDNRHIATVDADGVALAAIQALYARVVALEKRLTPRNP